MIYPQDIELRLGFDKVRAELYALVESRVAIELIDKMFFNSVYDRVVMELEQTHQMQSILRLESVWHKGGYEDTLYIKRLKLEGTYIDVHELMSLNKALTKANSIKIFFLNKEKYYQLHQLSQMILPTQDVIVAIDKIVDGRGMIKDSASIELAQVRKEINNKSSQVGIRLQQILKQAQADGYADTDSSVTLRDGRAVIPINSGSKRKVKGFIHSESSTGKTSFIEPLEVVELNNEVRELEIQERNEIIQILKQFTIFYIKDSVEEILEIGNIVGQFEFIEAKGRYAEKIGATKPIITTERLLRLRKARHPLLESALRVENKQIVSLNMELDTKRRILLISGSNAGGKSVCLKTVGLLQYMLQCGLLVPLLANSEVCLFSSIFLDIGDQQSIDNDLSTYSSHLRNMRMFLRGADSKTLILIDEFGGGTEPMIGGAIAEAVLEKLLESDTFGVITTHYSNLKSYAAVTEGIDNGAMTFDVERIVPLFALEQGKTGNSFAVEIARKMGLPHQIIERAQQKIGVNQVSLEKQLRAVSRDRRYWESKRDRIRLQSKSADSALEQYESELDVLMRERGSILKQAKEQAKKLISDANKEIERTIREIKEAQAEQIKTKELRGDLEKFKHSVSEGVPDDFLSRKIAKIEARERRRAEREGGMIKQEGLDVKAEVLGNEVGSNESKELLIAKDINVGDIVILQGQSVAGEVVSISSNRTKAQVQFGSIELSVELDKLLHAKREHKRGVNIDYDGEHKNNYAPINKGTYSTLDVKLNFKDTIDLRGERTVEALEQVKLFLDQAVMANASVIRILHGKGNGILKYEIQRYLREEPYVDFVEDEHVDFGGAGITVVTLK